MAEVNTSRIVYGSTTLGNLFEQLSDEVKSEIVAQWLLDPHHPITIDSAGKYGAGLALEVIRNELLVREIHPDQVILSNKLGWRRIPLVGSKPSFEPDAWIGLEYDAAQDFGYAGIIRCWEEGNALLCPYQARWVSVHDPDDYLKEATSSTEREKRWTDILGAYDALFDLKSKGQVDAVGIGAKDWNVIKAIAEEVSFDWVMVANSLTVYRHPPALLSFLAALKAKGTRIFNAALLHGGFLSGGSFFDYQRLNPNDVADAARMAWRVEFSNLCNRYEVTPIEAAIAFSFQFDFVDAVAVSSNQPQQVEQQRQATRKEIPCQFWNDMRSRGLLSIELPSR